MLTNPSKTASEPVQSRQAWVRWGMTGLLNPHNRLILSVAELPFSDSLLLKIILYFKVHIFLFVFLLCCCYILRKFFSLCFHFSHFA